MPVLLIALAAGGVYMLLKRDADVNPYGYAGRLFNRRPKKKKPDEIPYRMEE